LSNEFEGRVAIVTGAANGLGRSHARALADAGAKVVVSDLGTKTQDGLAVSAASLAVVEEIVAAGGTAVADFANVAEITEVEALVARTLERFGRIDILVNNAGMLRDKSFAKMDLADFRAILDVHVMGSVNMTKAVWPIMRAQNYGRIVFTSSASGLFGNFGQANYGAAKAAMLGLMNVLHIEGAKHDIRVNALAPTAATAMTEGLLPPGTEELLVPDTVSPAVLFLVSEDAPSKMVMGAGGGVFTQIHVLETAGVYLPPDQRRPADIARHLDAIADLKGAGHLEGAFEQSAKFVEVALSAIRASS
jgi:NAD(P)-dependent dehydrogenase (short-subunit alcohol dehydrogenase family)